LMHVWGNKPLNPAIYFPQASCVLNGVTYTPCSTTANTDARRRFTLENPREGTKLGYVAELDDGGIQNYHGMLLSVERRTANGITAGANYTWSHCRSEEHTSELQSRGHLVCRLLLEKKKHRPICTATC